MNHQPDQSQRIAPLIGTMGINIPFSLYKLALSILKLLQTWVQQLNYECLKKVRSKPTFSACDPKWREESLLAVASRH